MSAYEDELARVRQARADAELSGFEVTHAPLHGEPTSHDAAVSMKEAAAQQCEILYDFLKNLGPATCDHADWILGWRPTTAGRRMPDLVERGLAEFTGETRKTRSGRAANVYRACVAKQKAS